MVSQISVQLVQDHQARLMRDAAGARLARQARGISADGQTRRYLSRLCIAGREMAQGLLRRHGEVKSFEHEVSTQGIAGRVDAGTRTVDRRKIVGSVGRAQVLRSDFFYRRGKAITARYTRVGEAMTRGVELPPLELYKVRPSAGASGRAAVSEYYVVDGHHRVAMARKLGQDFLDAHVVEYRLATPSTTAGCAPATGVERALG